MRVTYRGHEIDVERERGLGGWTSLFFSIFRESDGFECTSGSYDGDETVRQFIAILKERVDNELAEADPWGEAEMNNTQPLASLGAARSDAGTGSTTEGDGDG